MAFTFLVRLQFSFIAKNKKFSAALQALKDQNISITAYVVDLKGNYTKARIVLGLPDTTSQDLIWNTAFKKILDELKVEYCTRQVLQVAGVPAGTSGVLLSIYNALVAELKVRHIYLAEDTHRIIDCEDLAKAQTILAAL